MKNKATVITFSIFMVLLIGGVVTYAYMKVNKKPQAYAPIPSTLSSVGAANQDGSSLGVSTDGGTGANLQSNLGQSGGSGSGSSSSSAAKVPGPAEFGQYDQYKTAESAMFSDLVAGTGTEVAVGTKVAVTYQGWLTDGKLFDQSRVNEEGKTEAFTLTIGEHKVILGWEQGLVGMKVGGKRRIIVPPAVGYGEKGKDPVPPNALLVFDVTLHDAL